MKPVLIVENSTNSLIRENASTGKKDYILGGTFTEFGIKNRNERIYTAAKFLPALEEMNERMNNLGIVYGEFDHPDVFDTSLSRASHVITKANYVKESNLVEGEIRLLSTYWGKEAKSLVDDGCPIFVSSRAAGITESDGTVSLKKLFTYDIVADPGFASAKMSVKVLNESLGYDNPKSNFRIYDLSNESKTEELFNMNNNEFVTKQQLTDYSQYLVKELASTKKEVKTAITKGNMNPKKLEQLLEYYDELNNTNSQVAKYLDYLAEKVQIMVNENKSLKETTEKLIKHNDYLAENLEKAVNYSEYLAENLDKNIAYSEYVAENVDKNIAYSEYVAENLDKNIAYSEYVAENLDKNIAYSEYIAENLDKNIAYSEYIAENLDKSIAYGEYIAEHVDNSIAYSEYLAEHVEGNIAYSEYIAENLDDNIAYSEYIAENLDKSINYQGLIVEKLNGGKLNESEGAFPSLNAAGFENLEDENEDEDEDEAYSSEEDEDENGIAEMTPNHTYVHEDNEDENEDEDCGPGVTGNSDSELSESIDKLIEEAKKRKVSETSDLNFLKFMSKSQVDSYYALTNEEQDTVKLHINERSYFTQKEVLSLISESLSTKNESLEERVIRMMPENTKAIWSQLNESAQKSIISQARLYPADVLTTEGQVEHFWATRNLKKNESVSKKLVSHEALIQEDKLSDNDVTAIMERFKNV
jgi:peptidoglycan DL-endopeptidase CwlO